jgi:hypothetical protein
MKRYTLRAAIHDTKIFAQLRREYRRTNKNRGNHFRFDWLSKYLTGMRHSMAVPIPSRHDHSTG